MNIKKNLIQEIKKEIRTNGLEKIISEIKKENNLNEKKIIEQLAIAYLMNTPKSKEIEVNKKNYVVTKIAQGPIKNNNLDFYQINFKVNDLWQDYKVLLKANLSNDDYLPKFDTNKEIYLRIDSGCEPGQIFNDQMCDCRNQLKYAIQKLGESEQGLIIHIPNQDGRGKGTDFHLATLYLQQELNINTVESFSLMEKGKHAHNLDSRTYEGAISILKYFEINQNHKINFGTNNPLKINPMIDEGFNLIRSPIIIDSTLYTQNHLNAKKKILGHYLR